MPGVVVDGMDVEAVHRAAAAGGSAGPARGDGPTLIECKTYRYRGHSRGDPGRLPRRRKSIAEWTARDPIERMRAPARAAISASSASSCQAIERDAQADGRGGGRLRACQPRSDARVGASDHVFAAVSGSP